jgi:5-methylcytosine-specific restriction endonuclease McrA
MSDSQTTVKSIQPQSTEGSEQLGIINMVPKNQTNQVLHLKGLFVPRTRTTSYVPEQIPKPCGFYMKPCKRCQSMNTTKSGKLVSIYQRCDSCEQRLDIPSNAKSLGMSTKDCTGCRKVNNVKYFQRWYCVDCGLKFLDTREWQQKEQQREGPLKTNYDTWPKIRGRVYERDNYTCQVCGKTDGRLAAHHIIPRRDGGQDSMDNLITVCDGVCHKKIEPYREKFNLFVTGETYHRMKDLIGNEGNDEAMLIRMCEELEKQGWVIKTETSN